jgi:S1-C subfamily serine protease
VPSLRLRPVSGPRRGQELEFSGPRVRIGRSRDNDLILPEYDPSFSSAHHAEALLDSSGSWWIVDAGSSNGTRLNGAVVQRHELKTGDRLALGSNEFAVAIGHPPRRWLPAVAILIAGLAVIAVALATLQRPHKPFEKVATSAAQSVYLIAIEEKGKRSVVGTGFAVAGDALIATNAHVAYALQQRGAAASASAATQAFAVQGDTYDARPIVAVSIHPRWRQGSMRDDIALLRLAPGPTLTALALGDISIIGELRRGTPVAAFGFPAISTDPMRPRGRLSVDVVGDVRGEYLEVGLGIAPGTSGSPVFGESGTVVAIVVGGDFVETPGGATRPSGSAANWALSAQVLRDFLASPR